MEWTLLIGAGVVVLAVVLAVLRVRQLNQPHATRPAGDRPAGGSPPPYYTRRTAPGSGSGGASGGASGGGSGDRAEEIRAAKRRIDELQGDGHRVPVQQRVALTLDTLPDRTRRKVERLVKQGRDASAINAIRTDTGAGLNEARRIVEDLRRPPTDPAAGSTAGPAPSGHAAPGGAAPGGDIGPGGAAAPGAQAEPLVPEPGGFARHARALKSQGRTEAAVRLVIRETGMSDDEAEAFVSALDTD